MRHVRAKMRRKTESYHVKEQKITVWSPEIAIPLDGLSSKAWIWLNGKIAGTQPFHEYWHRWRYHHELDITERVRYGEENSLAIRIINDQDFCGIFRRCFVFAPTGEPEE